MDQELVELARNLSQRYLIVLAPDGQGWRAWALDYPECDALSTSAEAAIAEVRRQLAEEALTCLQEGHLPAVPTQLTELLGALEERGTPEEPLESAGHLAERYPLLLAQDGTAWKAWALDWPGLEVSGATPEVAWKALREAIGQKVAECLEAGRIPPRPTQLQDVLGTQM